MTHQPPRPTEVVHISQRDLASIAQLLQRETGIHILPTQASMLQSRLGRRLRSLGIRHFVDYVNLIQTPQGQSEFKAMISALTTNVTSFYRERHHFDFFVKSIAPNLIDRARAGNPVRIWSAGCSSGPEPFSLAMCLCKMADDIEKLDIKILGTDIDCETLKQARTGTYAKEMLSSVSQSEIQQFFKAENDKYTASSELRNIVHFKELNLNTEWPMKRPFDVIFCRNVAIYFDMESQMRLWNRLENALNDGGWLFMGHSERIPPTQETHLESAGITIYRAQKKQTPIRRSHHVHQRPT